MPASPGTVAGGRHPVTTPSSTARPRCPPRCSPDPPRSRSRSSPVPALGPDEVLVEVGWCGICGTDLHLALEGYGRPGTRARPRVVGHHRRARRRRDRARDRHGDRRRRRRGRAATCRPCRRGRPSVCLRRPPPDHLSFRGAFARYVVVERDRVLPIPAGLDPRAAALTEPVAIALHAMHVAEATEPGLRDPRDRRGTRRPAHGRGARRPRRHRRDRERAGARPRGRGPRPSAPGP